jgi:dTDP-4-amino-4,6-dideoxygalactose transaminase
VVHTGATPVFVDVLDEDLNIDPDAVRAAVTRRTKAIMPVHLAGAPANLEPLLELGVPVVEDAAHAVETVYRGRKVGSISDATAFSLYATKNVAAGEGGILTTDDDRLARDVLEFRLMRRGHGTLYDIEVAGYKANLSDVLAALALVQLGKIEEHAAIRKRHFAAYDAGIADLDGIEPLGRGEPGDVHARHLYVVRIDPDRAGGNRDEYQRALAGENIGSSIHFLPVHRLTYYAERFPELRLPVAERAGSEVLSLPLSPAHSDEDISDAIEALRRVHRSLTTAP